MSIDLEDDDERLFGGGVAEIEARADLMRARALGAQVEVELTEDTPFARYVAACRRAAIEAMASLATIDPHDAVAIVALQQELQSYLRVRNWSRGQIEQAMMANDILQEGHRG